MNVPLLDLNAQYAPILTEIKQEIEKVFDSHHYILGPQVKEFEKMVTTYCECNHAIGCAGMAGKSVAKKEYSYSN